MRTARVYNDTGRIAAWGKNPKPIPNTTQIKEPVPDDYNQSRKPYLWNFVSEIWSVDQDIVEANEGKKVKREKKLQDEQQAYADTKALLDDPSTRWNDPTGDILKSLAEHINKLTINAR